MKRSPMPRRTKGLSAKSDRRRAQDSARDDAVRARARMIGLDPNVTYRPAELLACCEGREVVPEINCRVITTYRAVLEPHEVVKRSRWRAGILDVDNVRMLCQAHHDWTEDFPNEATERGLLRSAMPVSPFDKFDR